MVYYYIQRWYRYNLNYITNLDCNNIELLYFDFKSNNSIFNFGGARRHGQLQCNDDDIVLFLDSDIILPNNFLEIINTINFENNVLYGIRHRYDYHSKESFKNNTPYQIQDMSIHKFIFGFFNYINIIPIYYIIIVIQHQLLI